MKKKVENTNNLPHEKTNEVSSPSSPTKKKKEKKKAVSFFKLFRFADRKDKLMMVII